MKHLLEGESVCRQVWIDGRDRRPDRVRDLRRVSLGPNRNGEILQPVVGHRNIDLLGIGSIQQGSPRIASHADALVCQPIRKNFALPWNCPPGAKRRLRPIAFCPGHSNCAADSLG